MLAVATLGHAVAIDMGEVRRIARQPVSGILRGTPIASITDADYRQKIDGSPRPVIVVFYAEQDEKSRNLATLARYLAQDFSTKIGFYAYRASDAAAVDRSTSERLAKDYGVRQIPATLFYDNDRGKIDSSGRSTTRRRSWSTGRRACSSSGRTTAPSTSTSPRASSTDALGGGARGGQRGEATRSLTGVASQPASRLSQ